MRWGIAAVAIQVFTMFLFPRSPDAADFLPPIFSPSSSNGSCDGAICGQGTCKASNNSFLGLFGSYSCECSPGWTKLFSEENFRFLPCVIPNCTMDYSCANETLAPAPAPVPRIPSNASFFDPCSLAMCGDGDCQKTTSPVSYHCNCNPGSLNLMNSTIFPCVQQCAVGTNCVQLGIDVPPTSSFPPGQSSNSVPPPSKAVTANRDYILWQFINLIMFLEMALLEV